MKITVQKNHSGGQIWYRSLDPLKKRRHLWNIPIYSPKRTRRRLRQNFTIFIFCGFRQCRQIMDAEIGARFGQGESAELKIGPKNRFLAQNFYFWPKFLFLIKSSIFDQNFYFLTKSSIFWRKFLFFIPKFLFLTKIFIFHTNFYFWLKFRFVTKLFIVDQSLDFRPKIVFFKPKFRFLSKCSMFDQNFEKNHIKIIIFFSTLWWCALLEI